MIACLGVSFFPNGTAAQRSEIALEVGASSVRPPSGMEGDAASFLVAGVRGMHFDFHGTGFMAGLQGGRTLTEESGGDFLSGMVDGSYWHPFPGGWSLGIQARGFAFEVTDPYPYRAAALEGGPALRYAHRNLSATLNGTVGSGWSRTELIPYADEEAVTLQEDLWRYGLSAEVLAGNRTVMAGLAAGIHESPGGTYRSVGGRILLKGAGSMMEITLDTWDTPLGNETVGGLAMVIPMGAWSLRGFLGKSEPDPLTLAEPGGGSGGIMVGRRIWGTDPLPPAKPPLHQVLDQGEKSVRVRLRVEAPVDTREMQVLGDFTFWEPVAMEEDGGVWVVVLEMTDGVHHFGFLADGEWFVPEDAPDAVSDEWGRKNATLVIEK